MNPDTNRFEKLQYVEFEQTESNKQLADVITQMQNKLIRPDGTPFPDHWSVFNIDEVYEINGYTFRCKYVGETSILFEPEGPIIIGEEK